MMLIPSIVTRVMAQDSGGWAPDRRIPGYLDDTLAPVLLSDQNRTVHAFASQKIQIGEDQKQAIVYRQWTLTGGWTRPIDVLLSPTGDAQILDVFLDSKGVFHLAFWGGKPDEYGNVYYSSVRATNANKATAWSLPELVGVGGVTPSYGALAGDNSGNVILIFNGRYRGNGVYMVKSTDSGQSWSETIPVYSTNDPDLMPFYIKSYVGKSGKLHLVWCNNELAGGVYHSLYYAGIDLTTGTWSKPLLLDKRPQILGYFGPSFPAIVDNGDYVVIMYNGGNPFEGDAVPLGRPTLLVRISRDNGATWGSVTNPFPFLTGNSGELTMMVDSHQVVHAVAIMRIDTLVDGKYGLIGGVWHSEFKDGAWNNPQRFVTTISPANIRGVVSQGNILLTTWIEDAGAGQDGVWYSHYLLGSPELQVVPLPAYSEKNTPTPTITVTSGLSTSEPDIPIASINENRKFSNPAQPLIVAIIVVSLFFLGLFIVVRLYEQR
jgi:hypothetical protein